jgi:hypothetical protein
MDKKIIFPNPEGGVVILTPADEARQVVVITPAVTEIRGSETVVITPAETRMQTDEEFLAWVAAKDIPAGIPFKIVDASEIPTDRTFRNAWEYQL